MYQHASAKAVVYMRRVCSLSARVGGGGEGSSGERAASPYNTLLLDGELPPPPPLPPAPPPLPPWPLGTNSIASPAPAIPVTIPFPPPLPGEPLPPETPPIGIMRGDGDPPGPGPPLKGEREPLNIKGEPLPPLLAYTLPELPCNMPCASRALSASALAAMRYLTIVARFCSLGFCQV